MFKVAKFLFVASSLLANWYMLSPSQQLREPEKPKESPWKLSSPVSYWFYQSKSSVFRNVSAGRRFTFLCHGGKQSINKRLV